MNITAFFLNLATVSFVNDASSKLFLLFHDWHFNSRMHFHHLVMENGEKGILSRNQVSNEKADVSI